MQRLFLAFASFLLAAIPFSVHAEDLPPKSLWSFSTFRTQPGMSDDYIQYLATVWRAQRQVLVEEGIVRSYHVFVVNARRKGEPDIIIATQYANYVTFAKRAELEQIVRLRLRANPPVGAPQGELDDMREWLSTIEMEELDLGAPEMSE